MAGDGGEGAITMTDHTKHSTIVSVKNKSNAASIDRSKKKEKKNPATPTSSPVQHHQRNTTAKNRKNKEKLSKAAADTAATSADGTSAANGTISRPSASNPFLQIFWDLSSDSPHIRVKATQNLLESLKQQKDSSAGSQEELKEDEKAVDTDLSSASSEKNQSQLKKRKRDGKSSIALVTIQPNSTYALKRLLRGVCSSDDAAKRGFGTALTQVLTAFPDISVDSLRGLMTENLKVPTNPSRSELSDHHSGYLTCLLALSTASRLAEFTAEEQLKMIEKALSYSKTQHLRERSYQVIVAVSKSMKFDEYISQVLPRLLQVIQVNVNKRNKGEAEEKDDTTPATSNSVPSSPFELDSLSPDELYLVLSLEEHHTTNSSDIPILPPASFAKSARNPLKSSSFPLLARVLVASSYTLPSLHCLWSLVWERLTEGSSKIGRKSKFWRLVVEGVLFGPDSNLQRRHIAFLFFHHVLSDISDRIKSGKETVEESALFLSTLFTPQFIHSFINNLKQGNQLHPVAEKARIQLITICQTYPSLTLTVISGLSADHPRFDSVSRTHTISSLLQCMDKESSETYAQQLINIFFQPTIAHSAEGESEVKEVEGDNNAVLLEKSRGWVIDQLHLLTRNNQIQANSSTFSTVLNFFTFFSFFNSNEAPQTPSTANKGRKGKKMAASQEGLSDLTARVLNPPLSSTLRQESISRLHSLLSEKLPKVKPRSKTKKEHQESPEESKEAEGEVEEEAGDENGANVGLLNVKSLPAYLIHDRGNYLISKGWLMTAEMEKKDLVARKEMLEIVDDIEKKYTATNIESDESADYRLHQRQSYAAAQLLLHLGILQLNEPTFATALMEDFMIGYKHSIESEREAKKKYIKSKSSKKKQQQAGENPEEDEDVPVPAFIELLVDVLLSLLIRPSVLFRELSKQIFSSFARDVNSTVIEDLLRIIGKDATDKEEAEEDEDDEFEPFGEIDEIEEEVEEEEEEESTEKKTKKKKNEKTSKPKSAQAENEADEEDELIDIDNLPDILSAPLTSDELEEAREAAAALHANPDDLSSNMDIYDNQLANIVKLRKEKKDREKELIEQTIHFQLRVTDLLDIFIKINPSSPLVLGLIVPFLSYLDKWKNSQPKQPVWARIGSLLRRIFKVKEHVKVVPDQQLEEKQTKKSSRNRKTNNEVQSAAGTNSTDTINYSYMRAMMTSIMNRTIKCSEKRLLDFYSSTLLYLIRLSLPAASLLYPSPSFEPAQQEHFNFICSLYKSALTSYLTQRHSKLNKLFFQKVSNSYLAIAFELLPVLAQCATTSSLEIPITQSTENEQIDKSVTNKEPANKKKGKKIKKPEENEDETPSTATSNSQAFIAASPYLRQEAFQLLHTLLSLRSLSSHPSFSSDSLLRKQILNAIHSSIVFAALPTEEKAAEEMKMKESASQQKEVEKRNKEAKAKETSANEEKEKEQTNGKKDAKSSKQEKQKEKKKRRKEREKAAKLAAQTKSQQTTPGRLPSNGTVESSDSTPSVGASKLALKTESLRVKIALAVAQQIVKAQRAGRGKEKGSPITPLADDSIISAISPLSSLSPALLYQLQAPVHSIYQSASLPLPDSIKATLAKEKESIKKRNVEEQEKAKLAKEAANKIKEEKLKQRGEKRKGGELHKNPQSTVTPIDNKKKKKQEREDQNGEIKRVNSEHKSNGKDQKHQNGNQTSSQKKNKWPSEEAKREISNEEGPRSKKVKA